MKNCLVQSLKGGEDNESMPLFKGFEIEFGVGSFEFYTKLPNGIVVSWDNDTDTIQLGSLNISSPYTHIFAGASDYWHGTLTQKTKFKFENSLYVNETFRIPTGTGVKIGNDYLLSMLKYGALNNILNSVILDADEEEISFEELSSKSFRAFSFANNSNFNVKGNIKSLNFDTTNELYLGLQGQVGIYGTLESVVKKLCTNGKVSGKLYFNLLNTECTFHGAPMTALTNNYWSATFDNSGAVVKDSSNVTKGTYTTSTNTWTYA